MSELEADRERFDREAAEHHPRLKRLYALLHLVPGERAQATLFSRELPQDSPRAAIRELTKLGGDPQRAAELVRRHRLPFLLVESALGKLSPTVAVALVETMEQDELISRLPLLSRRNLIDGEVRTVLLARLWALAETMEASFPYQKLETVVREADLDRQLTEAAFALVESGGERSTLEGDTALLIDASISMERSGDCLELAAAVAHRIDVSLAEDAKLHVLPFTSRAWSVEAMRGFDLGAWRRALTVRLPDEAGTAAGAGLEHLASTRTVVDHVVVVTDGYENRSPRLASEVVRYRAATGRRPVVSLVQPASSGRQLAMDLKDARIPFNVFHVDRHMVGLAALVPALRARASEDLVARIMTLGE